MYRILLTSKDEPITLLVDRARRAKKLQYVGFGGLPLGAVGIVSLAMGELTRMGTSKESGAVFDMFGGICIIAAIPFPIASIHFKKKRNFYNREAINLYNSKF